MMAISVCYSSLFSGWSYAGTDSHTSVNTGFAFLGRDAITFPNAAVTPFEVLLLYM